MAPSTLKNTDSPVTAQSDPCEAPSSRRDFVAGSLGTAALAAAALVGPLAGTACADGTQAPPSPPLSKEEKDKLKAELQRELERRVYTVDDALFRKINRAQDPQALKGHERSHVPRIVAPARVRPLEAFQVRVEVGVDEIHEMNTFHYIDWLTLQVDGVQVNAVTLTPLFNRPVVTFDLVLQHSATLTAQEHCNLHGIWESGPVRVEVG